MRPRHPSNGQKKRKRHRQRIRNRNNRQRYYYSGKKKRHTLKSQVIVDKRSKKIICTSFCNGKKHDFQLFKDSRVRWNRNICCLADTGYVGIKKLQPNSQVPVKRSAKKPLTKDDRRINQNIASERVLNENVIGCLKRFRILSDRYRNRRKRFGLRFNLIVGIYNFEIGEKDGSFGEGKVQCPRS